LGGVASDTEATARDLQGRVHEVIERMQMSQG